MREGEGVRRERERRDDGERGVGERAIKREKEGKTEGRREKGLDGERGWGGGEKEIMKYLHHQRRRC